MRRMFERAKHHIHGIVNDAKVNVDAGYPGTHHLHADYSDTLQQHSGRGDFHNLFIPVPDPANTLGDLIPADNVKIKVGNVTFLGDVHSKTTYVKRDLGFHGQIGAYHLLTYGDSLYTDSNYSDGPFRGMTSDSVALATRDPLWVIDPLLDNAGNTQQFVKLEDKWGENMAEWACGITNVVETGPNEGVIYFLLNHRPGGINHIEGAGIARVHLDTSVYPPRPSATRLSQKIWDGDTEPWWGDCSILQTKGYLYLYGNKRDSPFTYLARVKVVERERLECYEYWHGKDDGWKTDRLRDPNLNEKQHVFWQVNQGQVIWSEYFKQYLFVHCDSFWSAKVIIKSAPSPEGPWSDPIDVYKATPITEGGNIYAAAPQPQFDPSGKTLVVTFTNHPNVIQAIRVEFA